MDENGLIPNPIFTTITTDSNGVATWNISIDDTYEFYSCLFVSVPQQCLIPGNINLPEIENGGVYNTNIAFERDTVSPPCQPQPEPVQQETSQPEANDEQSAPDSVQITIDESTPTEDKTRTDCRDLYRRTYILSSRSTRTRTESRIEYPG
jgi:hypothetical protein